MTIHEPFGPRDMHFINGGFPWLIFPFSLSPLSEKLIESILLNFGSSTELINSAAKALKGKTDIVASLRNSIHAANQVSGSCYEYGTSWGTTVSNQKMEC